MRPKRVYADHFGAISPVPARLKLRATDDFHSPNLIGWLTLMALALLLAGAIYVFKIIALRSQAVYDSRIEMGYAAPKDNFNE